MRRTSVLFPAPTQSFVNTVRKRTTVRLSNVKVRFEHPTDARHFESLRLDDAYCKNGSVSTDTDEYRCTCTPGTFLDYTFNCARK